MQENTSSLKMKHNICVAIVNIQIKRNGLERERKVRRKRKKKRRISDVTAVEQDLRDRWGGGGGGEGGECVEFPPCSLH